MRECLLSTETNACREKFALLVIQSEVNQKEKNKYGILQGIFLTLEGRLFTIQATRKALMHTYGI